MQIQLHIGKIVWSRFVGNWKERYQKELFIWSSYVTNIFGYHNIIVLLWFYFMLYNFCNVMHKTWQGYVLYWYPSLS